MEFLLNTEGPIGRRQFSLRFFGTFAVGCILGFIVYEAGYHFLHFKTVGIFWAIFVWVMVGTALFIQMMRRFQDLGIPSILFFIPVYNLYLLCLLFFKPGQAK